MFVSPFPVFPFSCDNGRGLDVAGWANVPALFNYQTVEPRATAVKPFRAHTHRTYFTTHTLHTLKQRKRASLSDEVGRQPRPNGGEPSSRLAFIHIFVHTLEQQTTLQL